MTEKHLTIDEKIEAVIAQKMTQFHDENKIIIQQTIKETVNGKIDNFVKEQTKVNNAQNQALADIKKSTQGLVDLYNGSNSFFRTTKTSAIWITIILGACSAVWAFIKFVILAAIK